MSEDVHVRTDCGVLVFTQEMVEAAVTRFRERIPMLPAGLRGNEEARFGIMCGCLGRVADLSLARTSELTFYNEEYQQLATALLATVQDIADMDEMRRKAHDRRVHVRGRHVHYHR